MDKPDIHIHCLRCFSNSCHEFLQCPIIYCPNQCGLQFHKCKELDHQFVCRRKSRPCINSLFGCPFNMDSVSMMKHLQNCPASVIHCGMNWNRTPLNSQVIYCFISFEDYWHWKTYWKSLKIICSSVLLFHLLIECFMCYVRSEIFGCLLLNVILYLWVVIWILN